MQRKAFPVTAEGNQEQKSPGPVTAAARPWGVAKSQTCLKACDLQRGRGRQCTQGPAGSSALDFTFQEKQITPVFIS